MFDSKPNEGSMGKGFGLAAAINLGAALMGIPMIFVGIGLALTFGIGIVQVCWIVPLCLMYHRREETATVKGMLLAAGITFLLNAGCWGFMASSR